MWQEIPFLLDQRGSWKIVISDFDKYVSKMWARAAARDEAMEVVVEIEKGQAGFRREQVQRDFSDDSADDAGNNNKSKLAELCVQTTLLDNSSKTNMSKLPNLASVCDRYGASNYADDSLCHTGWLRYYNQSEYKSNYWTTETGRREEAMQRSKARCIAWKFKETLILIFW